MKLQPRQNAPAARSRGVSSLAYHRLRGVRPRESMPYRRRIVYQCPPNGIETSLVEQQVVSGRQPELVKTGHVSNDEGRACSSRGRPGPRGRNRLRNEVDARHLPALAGHIDRGGPGATAEIQRSTRRETARPLDNLDQLRSGDAAVPWLESNKVGQAKK
jgi:hypothetical protein